MSGKFTRASVLLFSTGLILTLVVGCATSQRPAAPASPVTTAFSPVPPTATPSALYTATVMATEREATATPTESAPQPTAAPTTRPGCFSREELIEDARELAHILESTHPDPYIRGGGKIAFRRRLHQLLNAIPEDGMTRDEFVRLLRPFIAAVGDGHTVI
ncbi:MAG: hypothetical protein PVI07_18615, partial [Anaerolineae bacterium]